MLVAIDPGADTGWAAFDDGHLVQVGLGIPHLGGDVIIELPQIYTRSKADPNDLITLAVKVGQLKADAERAGCKVYLVHPHTWKGNAPKAVMGKRIVSRLDDAELEVLARVKCAASKRHNVVDAVGIALWRLGRL